MILLLFVNFKNSAQRLLFSHIIPQSAQSVKREGIFFAKFEEILDRARLM